MPSFWNVVIPRQYTSWCKNPYMEGGSATDWSEGTGGLTVTSERSARGRYSLKASRNDEGVVIQYTPPELAALTRYYVSCWVYIDSGFDAGVDYWALTPQDMGTLLDNNELTTDDYGVWKKLWAIVDIAGDTTGSFAVEVVGTLTQAASCYVDKMLIAELDNYNDGTIDGDHVTYFDGDMTEAQWIGGANDSRSEIRYDALHLGMIANLKDDLYFAVEDVDGAGIPPLNNNSTPKAIQSGSTGLGQNLTDRFVTLTGSIIADSPEDWHEKRRTLVRALMPFQRQVNSVDTTRTFIVTSPEVEKEIKMVYDSGLEKGLPDGWAQESINLKLRAFTPEFKGRNSRIVNMNAIGYASGNVIQAKVDGQWLDFGTTVSGDANETRVIHKGSQDGYIYVGQYDVPDGDEIAGTQDATGVAYYNPEDTGWYAMGTGLEENAGSQPIRVFTIIEDPSGNIYVGGRFGGAGGVADTDGFAKWNGTTWSKVGDWQTENQIYCAYTHRNGDIYVGGNFTDGNNLNGADYIMRYDAADDEWDGVDVSNGLNGVVNAIIPHPTDSNKLLVGGEFTNIGGNATWDYLGVLEGVDDRDPEWIDPAEWTIGGQVHDLKYRQQDGRVYAISYVGGFPTVGIGYNDGTGWEKLSGEFDQNSTPFWMAFVGDGVMWQETSPASGTSYRYFFNIGSGELQFVPPTNPQTEERLGTAYVDNQGNEYYGAQNSVNVDGQTTISYEGTAPANPKIHITKNSGFAQEMIAARIINEATKATLYLDYELAVGETLTIDTDPTNPTIISSTNGEVPSALQGGSDFTTFTLMPSGVEGEAQDNIISTYIYNGDYYYFPIQATALIEWTDTYISED